MAENANTEKFVGSPLVRHKHRKNKDRTTTSILSIPTTPPQIKQFVATQRLTSTEVKSASHLQQTIAPYTSLDFNFGNNARTANNNVVIKEYARSSDAFKVIPTIETNLENERVCMFKFYNSVGIYKSTEWVTIANEFTTVLRVEHSSMLKRKRLPLRN